MTAQVFLTLEGMNIYYFLIDLWPLFALLCIILLVQLVRRLLHKQ